MHDERFHPPDREYPPDQEGAAPALTELQRRRRNIDTCRSRFQTESPPVDLPGATEHGRILDPRDLADACNFLAEFKSWNLAYLQVIRFRYLDWKLAHDDDFWTTLHEEIEKITPAGPADYIP
jgi:hypothetical protein